jgi:formylglycine-generating enzyme
LISNFSAPAQARPKIVRAGETEMITVPGGTFRLGSDFHYPEEAPAHYCAVASFRVAAAPVTVGEFAAFCDQTGYRTAAEGQGSLVFSQPTAPLPLTDPGQWWRWDTLANWRAPRGKGSIAQSDHPVVHVTLDDAQAYAAWHGLRLPSEPEWEVAARGGLDSADFSWGQTFRPGMANIWSGNFPLADAGTLAGPTAVRSFPANGYGLYDFIGNVWEWTTTTATSHAGCAHGSTDKARQLVLKGGSFLCAANYCARYRPAAKIGYPADATAEHIGFRCFGSVPEEMQVK